MTLIPLGQHFYSTCCVIYLKTPGSCVLGSLSLAPAWHLLWPAAVFYSVLRICCRSCMPCNSVIVE